MYRTYHIPIASIFLAFLATLGGIAVIGHRNAEADEQRISCAALRTAGLDPQSLFDADVQKYKRLDRDKDLIVCE